MVFRRLSSFYAYLVKKIFNFNKIGRYFTKVPKLLKIFGAYGAKTGSLNPIFPKNFQKFLLFGAFGAEKWVTERPKSTLPPFWGGHPLQFEPWIRPYDCKALYQWWNWYFILSKIKLVQAISENFIINQNKFEPGFELFSAYSIRSFYKNSSHGYFRSFKRLATFYPFTCTVRTSRNIFGVPYFVYSPLLIINHKKMDNVCWL